MTKVESARRILFVSPKRDAQPVLSQLRSSGHQVSLVEDLDEAGSILGISSFDQAVIDCDSLSSLLEQRMLIESQDVDGWRRSTAAIVHDLGGLLAALAQVLESVRDEPRASNGRRIDTLTGTVDSLSVLAEELMQELVSSPAAAALTTVDLEDVAEAAAAVVYPIANERRQKLTIEFDARATVVKTNPQRLKRALKNVLEFVSDRAPENGSVAMTAFKEDADCVLSVSCNGNAITRSEMGRLFSRHAAGGRSGPLVLAQELVDQLGGRLWIESERDAGVSVFVAIPRRVRRGEADKVGAGKKAL